MKFLNFFLLLWVILALLDPDPDSEYGSGSTDLIESGSGSKTLIHTKRITKNGCEVILKVLGEIYRGVECLYSKLGVERYRYY
jgi:hypothetical protein